MITLNIIQNRISEAIRQSGLSQSEIARRIDVKQQTVNQYVVGKALPALDTFANLCGVLDIDPAYILGMRD